MKWILNDLTSLLDQHEDTGTRKGRDEGHRKAWLLIPAMSRRQGGRRYGRRPWRFRRGFRRGFRHPGRGVRHEKRWLWRLTSPERDILWHPVTCQKLNQNVNQKVNQCEPISKKKTMENWLNHVKSWSGSAGLITRNGPAWPSFLSHQETWDVALSRGQGAKVERADPDFWPHLLTLEISSGIIYR